MEPIPGNGAAHDTGPVPIPPRADLAAQWRTYLAARDAATTVAVAVLLPSGMTVRATRPSLLSLLGAKRIPDALAGPVQELIALATVAGAGGAEAELNRRRAETPVAFEATFLAIMDAVWLAAVVEPRFSEDPADETALPLGVVSIDDKTFLFVWAQGVDQSLAEFRERKERATAPLGVAPDREGIRPGPGGAAGTRSEG